ncbi:MAG: AmmeMemoRadiSam system radical SAM enzyme [Candidatus Nanoarchaeia archaeon]|nr:AmmeMemoRadiSam system radical SAM enzyme [Candidatus Nanoarchaeia archaeon]
MSIKDCIFYKSLKNKEVKCLACNHYCIIKNNNFGICKVRKNIEGKLYLMIYGKVISENIDPVEKKPLYHFMPGTLAYSVGTIGCNFKCSFCQNYDISQESNIKLGIDLTPIEIVNNAIGNGCQSIAYTYNEPTIAIEYWLETMKLAKKEGIKNILVTNGYISKEALKKISPFVDAMNIDIKSFSEKFYNETCKAKLKPVLETIKLAHKLKIWIELTTLIIPNKNDSKKEIENIARFVKSVDENIPMHLSRYFPSYKMKEIPTPLSTMNEAYKICKKILKNVYLGNIGETTDTICQFCKKTVIKRIGYSIILNLDKNKCKNCKEKIGGVF